MIPLLASLVFVLIVVNVLELQDRKRRFQKLMATLAEQVQTILDAVSVQSTKLDSVIALIDGLKQQLADALSGVTVPPAVQAKITEVLDGLSANAAKIVDALDENVEPPVEP